MHYHNPFHQKRHTTKASHGIKFVTSITTTIALILVCALAVSQIIPTDRTNRSAKVAQGKTTRSKKPVKTTFTPASGEFRGVWISFQDIGEKRYTKKQFENFINKTFDNCKKNGFNAIIVHVRPFADALYPSSYFPWSRYVSGKAGKHPGFDPLSYAVSAAHKRGLAFHAWINPYRIASNTTNVYKLPKKSIARKWAVSKKASKRRNVLKWDGKLYFNPASKDVQNLVCNGVREIVRDYAVDGIHFDDYFYPNLGAKYKKVFDYKEYKAYAKRCKKKHKKKVSIVTWRRNNVSNMLKRVRTIVHRLDNNCVFGISPAGNIRNLYAKNNYYADVKKWMRSSKYIDYICPQIYWTFSQKTCPFRETTNKWLAIPRAKSVKVYVGLGGYRAGISKREAKLGADAEWGTSRTNLKRQLLYLRSQNSCGGFMLFSYSDLIRKSARSEMNRFTKLLKTVPSNAVGPTATPTAAPTTVPTAVPTGTNRCSNGQLNGSSNRNSSGSSNKLTDRYRQLIPDRALEPLPASIPDRTVKPLLNS